MTELSKNSLHTTSMGNIMFCSLAEGGAMGEPGGVIWANDNNEWFHVNYVFGDVSLDDILEASPVLKSCRFGMFGNDSETPEGWSYVNLGCGNHLIVNDSIMERFVKEIQIRKYSSVGEVYANWQECAAKLLTKANNA